MNLFRPLLGLVAVAAVFAMLAGDADARQRGSVGSRGTKTYSAPPPTATAPNTAAPINRSMTQPGQTGAPSAAARPPVQQPGGMFGGMRGILGGLALGFLGAGLFGMLSGGGFLSGLAGFASILGFLAQIALIAGIAFLAYRWWQRRSQPQPSYAGMPRQMTDEQPRSALGAFGGSGGNAAPVTEPLEIQGEDFNTFERLLGEIQTSYGREDLAALRSRVTPEMLSYYAEDFSENASRGVINELSDVKLLQGDLAESWREDGKEYATVAMRYSLKDRYVDRTTGRASDGNDQPQEAKELWTFTRVSGGDWLLSAIQQAQ